MLKSVTAGPRISFPPQREAAMLAFLRIAAISMIAAFSIAVAPAHAETDSMIVVVGAAGTEDYGEEFKTWAGRWSSLCETSKTKCVTIGSEPMSADQSDRDELKATIETLATGTSPLWIVMIGHGTPFGNGAKFNLRGPDVSSDEFADWLKPVLRRVAVINCTSSSGPFMQALSGKNRVIATATQNGAEINFARFGDYISQAMSNRDADLDHDEQVSLLEAFLTASKNVQRFYELDNRLATEHAILDDNGDKKGTPATFFRGIRATKSAKDGEKLDGIAAHQLILLKSELESKLSADQVANRDRLELELEHLRRNKSKLTTDDYFEQLEAIMVQVARLYAQPNDS